MTMLRDVFDIPEKVDASDFVLQLHQGVAAAERTLDEYVVTEGLAASFDEALGLVQRTLQGGSSKGAFVHGSFGSGKSHFMAVLHLLLTGNTKARALPGLQEVVAKRQAVLGANLLAIDYHLLGKESFEGALFEGYLDTVARLHPDVPPPVLHQSDAVLADAASLRQAMGDESFFATLNAGSTESSGWGKRSAAWTAETFDAGSTAPVGDPARDRLVNAVIGTLITSVKRGGEWLETATGLRAMTEHARGLGYDGVVLFLDELVLWLAQHLSDTHFIQDEASKVAKLVETEMSTLPVPIISFVARQRDLKDFLGGNAVGAEQVAIGQSFAWWEDRFERIELKAADLPQIVHRRLLTPVSPEAAREVETAVKRVQADSAAWGYLLTDANRSSGTEFALTYPFSPALVDAMIALSSLMQRERTALRLMGELLSAGRDELTVNDVIPVGDLFDVAVLGGTPPLTEDMKQRFTNAAGFYESKMRPYLLAKHGVDEQIARTLPRGHAFHTEDRLAKTLLVAGIAPGAPSLRNLTAAKLAALNWGTIASFIPGQQAQTVMTMVKQWAAEFGEVHIGEGADPVISLTLTGVNYDALLELVQNEDTDDNRRRLIRELLSEQLGIASSGGLIAERTHDLVWRGSKRTADIVFGNVRDTTQLSDDAFDAAEGRWKVVIDFPFDRDTYSPQDDLVRLGALRNAGRESTTLVWLPHFLRPERLADVGKLALLEYLLGGQRFDQYASQLNPGDREPARVALENNRRSLRQRLVDVLAQAYGTAPALSDDIDVQIQASEVISSLYPGLSVQPPVSTSLRAGLDSALRQALDVQYPEHPSFEPADTEVRRAELTTVLELARQAIEAGGRLEGIERGKARTLARVARPLRCGEVRETVYALTAETFGWRDDFTRWAAEHSVGDQLRVSALRDQLASYGMTTDVEDLVLLIWAGLEDREWVRAGTSVPAPSIGQVSSDMLLRPARLPSETEWAQAQRAAQVLFGATPQPRRSAASATRLARDVRAGVTRLREASERLVSSLSAHSDLLGLTDPSIGRLGTARRAASLLDALARERDDTLLLQVLAQAPLPDEPQALAHSMSSASDVVGQIQASDWELLGSAHQLGSGAVILEQLASVAVQEQLHAPLGPALKTATAAVREALLRAQPTAAPTPAPAPPVTPNPTPAPALDTPRPPQVDRPTHPDEIELDIDANDAGTVADLAETWRKALQDNPGKRLRVRWWLE